MSKVSNFVREATELLDNNIDASERALVAYSSDASLYSKRPLAVAFPRHEEDVCLLVSKAREYELPILPRTGGTSLAGQAVNEAVVLDFTKHMCKVEAYDPDQRRIRIQPGMVLDKLNAYVSGDGLTFGPDPASSNRAAMGGIVGNNSTGSHSIVYGMTADHVRSINMVGADANIHSFHGMNASMRKQIENRSDYLGSVFATFRKIEDSAYQWKNGMPKIWRRCGGYNFDIFSDTLSRHPAYTSTAWNPARVLCGSEGTLGVFSSIEVNLEKKPSKKALALLGFRDVHHALRSVTTLLQARPSAIELIDNQSLQRCSVTHHFRKLLHSFCEKVPYCFLVVEVTGEETNEVDGRLAEVQRLCRLNLIDCTVKFIKHPQQQANVWAVRKGGLGLVMSERTAFKPIPFIEDSAVPVKYLDSYVTQIEAFCANLGTQVVYYAHASAGCLHIRPMINTKQLSEVEKLSEIASEAARLVKSFGGALSSEHGDGRSRSWLASEFYGKEAYQAFVTLKNGFDPNNMFNPGNIVHGPDLTQDLRLSPNDKVKTVDTGLNFNKDNGLDGAIEMCNGAAICRKESLGTMCPPFMVTRDEHQSTRGRANLLRAVMYGQTSLDWSSKELEEAMELCVQCKACKSECPSSVDMAAIKTEYLYQRYKHKRASLLARSLAATPTLLQSSLARQGFVQNVLRSRIGGFVAQSFGITATKQLPLPVADGVFKESVPNCQQLHPGRDVVLFADTFCSTTEPHILTSATRVLTACGYKVHLLSGKCCGRTYMSKGFIDKARNLAIELQNELTRFAEAGIPVIGLEPGCTSAVLDDFDQLVQRAPQAYITSIETFLLQRCVEPLQQLLPKAATIGHALVHGHCHQKALWGVDDTVALLKALGVSATDIDAGCCGMAGSFGYEKKYEAVSKAMGERKLFPAVREMATGSSCVAMGTSCRHQIEYGTGKKAIHLVTLLSKALQLEDISA